MLLFSRSHSPKSVWCTVITVEHLESMIKSARRTRAKAIYVDNVVRIGIGCVRLVVRSQIEPG